MNDFKLINVPMMNVLGSKLSLSYSHLAFGISFKLKLLFVVVVVVVVVVNLYSVLHSLFSVNYEHQILP